MRRIERLKSVGVGAVADQLHLIERGAQRLSTGQLLLLKLQIGVPYERLLAGNLGPDLTCGRRSLQLRDLAPKRVLEVLVCIDNVLELRTNLRPERRTAKEVVVSQRVARIRRGSDLEDLGLARG